MVTGSFHVLWGQNLPVYDVDPLCVCFGLQMSYCSLLYALVMETTGPYAPIHLPSLIPGMPNSELVEYNLASWAATYRMYIKCLDKLQQ